MHTTEDIPLMWQSKCRQELSQELVVLNWISKFVRSCHQSNWHDSSVFHHDSPGPTSESNYRVLLQEYTIYVLDYSANATHVKKNSCIWTRQVWPELRSFITMDSRSEQCCPCSHHSMCMASALHNLTSASHFKTGEMSMTLDWSMRPISCSQM